MIHFAGYQIIILILVVNISNAFRYEPEQNDSLIQEMPKIFIDCEECDMDYIKTEIPFVNYVIERRNADIYVLITKQMTAGLGTEFTIIFIGQKFFSGMSDTLKYNVLISDSDDTIRRGLAQKLKLALVRYLAKTPFGDKLSITMPVKKVAVKPYDPWHNWIFNFEIYTFLRGQQRQNFNNINTSFSINKIEKNWKILNNFGYNYTYNVYKFNNYTMINETKSYSGSNSIVLGINKHFSICSYLSFYSSTYDNIYISSGFAPALEYSIFPYEQSTTRKLTIQYNIGYIYYEYYEFTIFNKLREELFKESGSINAYIKQSWGSLNISLRGSHYFHDFKKKRVTIFTNLSLPLLKGLSFKIHSYASMIHDQLSLPRRELTEEEIILQKKLLATQYSYYISIGVSYTFGSIYSNFVNPRFDN